MERQMNLQFKGERDYLHGTDILGDTVEWLTAQKGQIKDIDFAFHHLSTRQLKAIVGTPPEGIKPVAACSFTANNVRQKVYIIEMDQPVTGRYSYPEDKLVEHMEMDLTTRVGILREKTAYTNIEVWVAMTKALHYNVFRHLKGKWLFVRARFPKYVAHSAAAEHSLCITASFNDKLTRSDVLLDGLKVGEIYFSIL